MMPTTEKLTTSNDPKGRKATDVFRAAYDKACLTDGSEGSAQFLNENPEFADKILAVIQECSAQNQYADEVTESNYTYPSEYKGPKPIMEQIMMLTAMFELDSTKAIAFAENLPALPEGAEGWFAIPNVPAIGAKFFPEITNPAERYCQAVKFVVEKITSTRKLYNWMDDEDIDTAHLRGHARTIAKFGEIKATQDGDILIIAAQLGKRHRGKSVRRARETFMSNEFGLGAFAVCCIALIHPERLVRTEELDMDCAGDEFAPVADGDFSESPFLNFNDDKDNMVAFGAEDIRDAFDNYGSVSGFVPQS